MKVRTEQHQRAVTALQSFVRAWDLPVNPEDLDLMAGVVLEHFDSDKSHQEIIAAVETAIAQHRQDHQRMAEAQQALIDRKDGIQWLHEKFADVALRHRLAYHGTQVEEDWLDENGLIDINRMPGYLQGQVERIRQNNEPMVDELLQILLQQGVDEEVVRAENRFLERRIANARRPNDVRPVQP